MEQENIYKGSGAATIADAQIQAVAAVVPTYFCPARRSPRVFRHNPGGWYPPFTSPNPKLHAQADYAASIANNSDINGFLQRTFNHDKGDGVPGTPRRPPIRITDLIDGTSNTLIAGDKRLRASHLHDFQGDDNEGYTSGWDHDTLRRTDLAPLPDCLGSACPDGQTRFGSSHTNGFNALLGDGSVRFISYSINLTTFGRLGHRMDGLVVNDF
jgi:hypothetical protein